MQDLNFVSLSGNLTRDPELRSTGSGTAVCSMRVANNERVKNRDTGEWGDRPNYFDVTVWAGQGENCARYLSKGSRVYVHGRLQWREWQTSEGQKRQAVEIVADKVVFGSPPSGEGGGGGSGSSFGEQRDGEPVGAGSAGAAASDDIPFHHVPFPGALEVKAQHHAACR